MRCLVLRILFVLLSVSAICCAAPEPAVVQGPSLWTAEVRFEPLRQLAFRRNGTGDTVRFWYTILTIENNCGVDIDFHPLCDLMTDTFQIIPAGKRVPPQVFDTIKARHATRYPLLEPIASARSRILQGEENAIDVAIVWPDFDIRAKRVQLFISGLSNETARINLPTAAPGSGQVYLRKTLELDFQFKGDSVWRSDEDIVLAGRRWVMR